MFRPLAWLLCLAVTAASIFFVWAYGVSFGNDKTYQWLVSVLAGIIFDVLVKEPLKVISDTSVVTYSPNPCHIQDTCLLKILTFFVIPCFLLDSG